ncbi:MAG: RNA polymerase sigma factor [Candidatus Brocadiia bacterium]
MDNFSDTELIALCKTGSEKAFTVLYQRYRQTVINFAYQMLGDSDLASHVLQDTFVYVFRKIAEYQPTAKFSTFLFTVVRHICINILDKDKRRKEIPLEEWRNIIAVRDAPDPLDSLQKDELNRFVKLELERLPLLYREVIVLKIIQGLQYDEISEIIECPVGTVKSRLHNGLELLRNSLYDKVKNTDFRERIHP